MSYWQDIKDLFSKGSDDSMKKVKELSEYLFRKAKEGGETLTDKTKKELEMMKNKYDLHRKRGQFTDSLTRLGDCFLDLYEEKKDIYSNEALMANAKIAMDIENECKKLEGIIKINCEDPNLNSTDLEKNPALNVTSH